MSQADLLVDDAKEEFMALIVAWQEAGCAPEESEKLRKELRSGSESDVRGKREVLEKSNPHKFARLASELSVPLFRLLRDLTCNSAMQRLAREEETLLMACECISLQAEYDESVRSAATEFVANCCSGTNNLENRAIVWGYLNGSIPLWLEVNSRATAMLVHLMCGISTEEAERNVRLERLRMLVLKPQLRVMLDAFKDSADADTRIWLAWTFAALLRELNPEEYLSNLEEVDLSLLTENENVLDETESVFPIQFALHILAASFVDLRIRMNVLIKLARWTSENSVPHVEDGEKVLAVAVKLLLTAKEKNEEDLATDLFRLISNTLHRGDTSLRDYFRQIGGVHVLLNNTNLDPRYPSKREWALFAIREACAGNEETQRLIESLKPISLAKPYAEAQQMANS